MGRSAARTLAFVSILLWACGSESPTVTSTSHDALAARPPPVPAAADDPTGAGNEVVYQSTRVFDRGGNVLSTEESGPLAPGYWQRVARPWTHLDDAHIYHEQAWQRALSGGRSVHGYRVVRTPNRVRPRGPEAPAPPALDPRLAALAPGTAPTVVKLRLRDYPRWDVPLVPPPSLRSEDRAAALAERRAALAARERLFRTRADDLRNYLEGAGAEVVGLGAGGGWLLVRATPSVLAALQTRTDIARIDVAGGHAEDAAQINLGDVRDGRWLDADRFLAAGDSGEVANPHRHDYGDVVVGVIEIGVMEDEGCYLADGYGCSSQSRVREKISCEGTTPGARCTTVADLPDVDEPASVIRCSTDATCQALNPSWTCVKSSPTATSGQCVCTSLGLCSRHATQMTSTILGDYSGGQADGLNMGDPDPACAGGCDHDFTFKNRATGIAPEASLVFWGRHPLSTADYSQDDALAESFIGAAARHVDIVSDSWVWRDPIPDCNPIPMLALEEEAENAFDDGIFVVNAAGNTSDPSACHVSSPADLPKVFAVNGLPTGQSPGCETDYNKCMIVPVTNNPASSRGGATATTPDGVAHPGALSLIALAAPTGLRYVTFELGDHGTVRPNASSGGSSQATAVVSGSAALVKSFFLARKEDKWINSPGRLFTVMLALTDRHFDGTSTQRTTGSDPYWGFGRLKLRRFDGSDPAGQSAMLTETLDSAAPLPWAPFAPLAEGTQLVKCVLSQDEDMSDKPFVSEVHLTVELRSPEPGADGCSESDPLLDSLTDASFDVKKLVAFSGANAPPAGACVRVVIAPVQLSDVLTLHTFCYASSVLDDAQLRDSDGDGLVDADEIIYGTDPDVADTDGDGVPDGAEVHQRNTSPLLADTDGDGIGDATDRVTFDHCTTRGLGAPRLLVPPSAATLVRARPTLRWRLPANAEGARIEVCADEACLQILETIEADGTRAEPSADLPAGVSYWRAFARAGGDVGCSPSETRELHVRDANDRGPAVSRHTP